MKETFTNSENLTKDQLPSQHSDVLNKIQKQIYNNELPLAVAHKNSGLFWTSSGGAAGAIGGYNAFKSAFSATTALGSRLSAIGAISLFLTNTSINLTPASNMRLNLYNYKTQIRGSLTKQIKE